MRVAGGSLLLCLALGGPAPALAAPEPPAAAAEAQRLPAPAAAAAELPDGTSESVAAAAEPAAPNSLRGATPKPAAPTDIAATATAAAAPAPLAPPVFAASAAEEAPSPAESAATAPLASAAAEVAAKELLKGSRNGTGGIVGSSMIGLDVLVSKLQPCANKELCLGLVDQFLEGAPRQDEHPNGGSMVQTFGHITERGGGECGFYCDLAAQCEGSNCRFDVYDNAVAAIYLTKRGQLDAARNIMDALTHLLYQDAGELHLLYAAYTVDGRPTDWGLDTGNNAWVAMAYAHLAAATGEACYSAVGRAVLNRLVEEVKCDDQLGGFMGRMPRGKGAYRATEHNIDMFALARMYGEVELQEHAGRFVSQMYGFDDSAPTSYATSTSGGYVCDPGKPNGLAVAADVQFWNMLSGADPDPVRKAVSMQFSLRPSSEGGFIETDRDVLGDGRHLAGIRFTNRGSGAQWENTASAVMGLGFYDAVYAEQVPATFQPMAASMDGDTVLSMQNSLLHMLEEYGSVLASVRGGNFQAYYQHHGSESFPGGSDTGIGWTYLRYPHTAATAWTGLMILEANPFAPPLEPVPAADAALAASCPAAAH